MSRRTRRLVERSATSGRTVRVEHWIRCDRCGAARRVCGPSDVPLDWSARLAAVNGGARHLCERCEGRHGG